VFRLVAFFIFVITFSYPVNYNNSYKFFLLTALLVLYNLVELYFLKKQKPDLFFINPIFICTITVFGFSLGGVTNFFLINDKGVFVNNDYLNVLQYEFIWLEKAIFLICLSSVCMWLGYASKAGDWIFDKVTSLGIYEKVYSESISNKALIIAFVFAYLIKLYLFSIGLFGRILDDKYFEAGYGFKEGSEIRVLGNLSYIVFFILGLKRFSSKPTFKGLFIVAFLLEIMFAFVFAARGAIIIPFALLFISYYYNKKSLSIKIIIPLIISLILAFTIVAEFKNYALSKQFQRVSNPFETIQQFQQYKLKENSGASYDSDNLLWTMASRFNVVSEAAYAIRYKDLYGMENSGAPDITSSILRSPIDAVIPKFIQGENEFVWGYWFKNEVLNLQPTLKYSIAISPVGYFYMGGGPLLIFLGFLLFGIIVKITERFLFKANFFSIIIYVALLQNIAEFEGVFNGTIINTVRYLFIFPILFWFLFKKK
jgi:hypothetical protein